MLTEIKRQHESADKPAHNVADRVADICSDQPTNWQYGSLLCLFADFSQSMDVS